MTASLDTRPVEGRPNDPVANGSNGDYSSDCLNTCTLGAGQWGNFLSLSLSFLTFDDTPNTRG